MKLLHVLDESRVAELVSQLDVVAVMRRLFADFAAGGVTQPLQTLTLLPGDSTAGDFITYPAAISNPPVFGAKLSPYMPQATGAKVTAWTLLMSSTDGRPLMVCDAMGLTIERTAATTALAVDLLAPAAAGKLAVIGTGPVGIAHMRHTAGLRNWSEIACWSPSSAVRADAIMATYPLCKVASTLDEAVEGATVVLLCTSSALPVLDPRSLPDCRLVTSISTNAPNAHEIPPESLAELDVYCDYAKTTPSAAAEMRLAQELGWSSAAILGDLPALVAGRAERPARRAFFRSIGLGCEDIAMAAALHELLESTPVAGGSARGVRTQ